MCTVAVSHHDRLCYMKDSAHAACGGGRVDTHRPEEVDTHSQSSSNLIILLGSIFTFELFLTFAWTFCSFFDRPPAHRLLL
jgi:hypothetical protein